MSIQDKNIILKEYEENIKDAKRHKILNDFIDKYNLDISKNPRNNLKKRKDIILKMLKEKNIKNSSNMDNKIKNRGTGAGGDKTNKNGLPYEELTELKENERYKNFKMIQIKKKDLQKVKIDDNEYIKVTKNELKLYMVHNKQFNTESEKTLQPDECYIDEKNKVINIIEKKFQQCTGSVDEKIQTGPFKIWYYKKLYPEYNIKYCYCLSDWFKDKKYKPEMRYLNENNIKVFWGSEKEYQNNILDWIIDNKEFEPRNNELLNKLSELQLNASEE